MVINYLHKGHYNDDDDRDDDIPISRIYSLYIYSNLFMFRYLFMFSSPVKIN